MVRTILGQTQHIYFMYRKFTLALSDNVLHVTCTTECPLGGTDTRVIRATSPPYGPYNKGSAVLRRVYYIMILKQVPKFPVSVSISPFSHAISLQRTDTLYHTERISFVSVSALQLSREVPRGAGLPSDKSLVLGAAIKESCISATLSCYVTLRADPQFEAHIVRTWGWSKYCSLSWSYCRAKDEYMVLKNGYNSTAWRIVMIQGVMCLADQTLVRLLGYKVPCV